MDTPDEKGEDERALFRAVRGNNTDEVRRILENGVSWILNTNRVSEYPTSFLFF